MTNQELFERAVAGNWIAESFDRPSVADGVGKFYLLGSGPGYTNFSDTIDDGSVVFYAAFDDDCNREAGYATFNATDQSLTPIESTATLQNDKYVDGDVAPVPFPKGGTITGTFNAVAFNAIWAHIWDKNNPHEVDAGQVEQDNENLLGDNVQDALDNLSGIIAEWDNAIKSTAQNYVQELPPPNPQKGDMWTDVGVTGEQYVWEGEYWVSVTGGGLGVDLDDLDSYSSKITTDVVDDDGLYDIPLERVISSSTGEGKWVAGGDGSGVTFVPEAPEDGLQYGRENGTWTEIDAGGVWDSDGIEDADGNATGHYYHLSNAENTNIFKTTIGSDEVEMMGITSIKLSGFPEDDKNAFCIDAVQRDEWSETDLPDADAPMGRVIGNTGFTNEFNKALGTVIDGWGNISTSQKIQAADFLDADGNSIVYKYDRSHEHAPNIMLSSNMSDEGGIAAKLGGGQDTVSLMLSRGKFDPNATPDTNHAKPTYLYMGPNKRGVPSDLGSFEEPSKRFTNAYFEGKVQAADFIDADGNSIVNAGDAGDFVPYEERVANEWMAVRTTDFGTSAAITEDGVAVGFNEIGITNGGGGGSVTITSMDGPHGELASINVANNWENQVPIEMMVAGNGLQSQYVQYTNRFLFDGAPIQAPDYLDADGNSIVQPPVDLTGYATEAYVGQEISAIPPVDLTGYATEAYVGLQISGIPPPPAPEHVTSATRIKGYEHGLVTGSTPGFGGNNLFILGSNASGAYESRVMMGNGLSQQFSIMYAANFYKAGSPMLAAVDLIDTFTTIKSALTEEQTVEGLRTAVVSGLDAVIQKLQAMEDKAEEEGHKR